MLRFRSPNDMHFLGRSSAARLAQLLFICVFLVVSAHPAASTEQRRVRVGIGAGILGAILLNDYAQRNYAPRQQRAARERATPQSKSAGKSYSGGREQAQVSSARKARTASRSRVARQKKPEPRAAEAPASETASAPAPEKTIPSAPPGQIAVTSQPRTDATALAGGGKAPAAAASTAAGSATISTPGEIKSAQEHLKYLGYEVSAAGGTMDLKTKIAIMQFQESIGAPLTGSLTVEQLQALFVTAARQSANSN